MKQAGAEEVGLIHDDEGLTAALGQVGQGGLEAFAEAAGVVGGGDAEGGEDLSEEGLDGEDLSGEAGWDWASRRSGRCWRPGIG